MTRGATRGDREKKNRQEEYSGKSGGRIVAGIGRKEKTGEETGNIEKNRSEEGKTEG
jgi:hypothetical protein